MKVWEHVFALVSELNEKSSLFSFKLFFGIFLLSCVSCVFFFFPSNPYYFNKLCEKTVYKTKQTENQ